MAGAMIGRFGVWNLDFGPLDFGSLEPSADCTVAQVWIGGILTFLSASCGEEIAVVQILEVWTGHDYPHQKTVDEKWQWLM